MCLAIWQSYIHLYFSFWMITSVNINGLSPKLVCALLIWRSGSRFLMGKFHLFLTELSACNISLFSFWGNNLRKSQWIFTKLDMWIHIVEIWFGVANGQISQLLTNLSACNTFVFSFKDNNFSKSQRIFTKLDKCIDIVEVWFGIANWQISSIFDRVICPQQDNVGVLSFHLFI